MSVIDWLLMADPGISWQVLRDLEDAPTDVVAAERSLVAAEGWGARLLALQKPEGHWGDGAYFPEWTSTTHTLLLLRDLGLYPASVEARRAIGLVRDHVRWEHAGERFFDGEVEPCINGLALTIGAYFGQDVEGIAERLLTEQLEDGGWNCEVEYGSTRGSFNSTICVLEGLAEYQRATGGDARVAGALRAGQEYLLERRLLRRRSTGEIVDPAFTVLAHPASWHYDVLRALDHLRDAGVEPDSRIDEALRIIEEQQGTDGRWLLRRHEDGELHFPIDDGPGLPSRWISLRAMRVRRWAAAGVTAAVGGRAGGA